MQQGSWQECGRRLSAAAQQIEAAGADFLLLCTNTMHKIADQITEAINIPLLHIADPTAERLKQQGIRTVGLLGTAFTMEEDFYRGRLLQKHGLEVIIPSREERRIVHRVIFDELCRGEVRSHSRTAYLNIIESMHRQGAEAIIEGCTEIGMLVQQEHTTVPLFDTTALHVERAIGLALAG